jgi:hypothetical protein
MEETNLNTTKRSFIFVLLFLSVLIVFSVNTAFAAETMDDTYGKVLVDFQLITGYNGDLMEDKNITRVEMIAIISKLYASDFKSYVPPTVATFDDVKTTHWGYKYVEFAYEKGITTGKSANIFGASDAVNYNQVSIFLIKALGYDLKGLQYSTAATEIADQYGLSLLLPTDNTAILVRGDVFELIVKALLLDDVAGVLGFEMITSNSVQKDSFISRASEIINTPVAVYVGDGFFNIYYANGDLYTGEFDGSFPKGNGILKFADGNLYIGQFDKGMFNGYGILIWPEGDYYEGEWANDAYNGLGTYTFLDGSYQYGEWINDLLVKPIKEVTPSEIEAGTVIASDNLSIKVVGIDGLPLKGIALTVLDETNDVSYNLISNESGVLEVPKVGDFAIISLSLGDNSAYRFTLSKDAYMVTTVGTYKSDVTFELYK